MSPFPPFERPSPLTRERALWAILVLVLLAWLAFVTDAYMRVSRNYRAFQVSFDH